MYASTILQKQSFTDAGKQLCCNEVNANLHATMLARINQASNGSTEAEIFKGVKNPKIGHVTLDTHLSGTICHRQAETCYG